MLYLAGMALVAGFAVAILLAVRAGRVGPQHRQPRRAGAAAVAAIALAIILPGAVYAWWLSAFGLYLLGFAAWLLRGERRSREAHPWPVALDSAGPARRPGLVHHGSPLGAAVAVPGEHAAHGPPVHPPPPEPAPAAPPDRTDDPDGTDRSPSTPYAVRAELLQPALSTVSVSEAAGRAPGSTGESGWSSGEVSFRSTRVPALGRM